MEKRKILEREFHNKRLQLKNQDAGQYKVITANKKFYSITYRSRDYMTKWIIDHSRDKVVLDYCCGTGENSFVAAKYCQKLIGIDISDESISHCKEKAERMDLAEKTSFCVMDAENTEFENNSFDVIICSGVLHHLDINKAYAELSRILKTGGKIICVEPLKHNPIFQLYRRNTPQMRTKWETEHILRISDVNVARRYFNTVEYKYFNLSVLAAVPLRNTRLFKPTLKILQMVDDILLKIPFVQLLAWQVFVFLSKPQKNNA
jgi:ubiquinone/menaquinone biosynthesis C-methylase UbiE